MNNQKHSAKLRRKSTKGKIFKKRQFRGNQYTSSSSQNNITIDSDRCNTKRKSSSTDLPTHLQLPTSSSAKKIQKQDIPPQSTTKILSSFVFMDTDIIQSIVSLIGRCPLCVNNALTVSFDVEKKKGLAIPLNLSCTLPTCMWEKTFFTSKKIEKNDFVGDKTYEINCRSIIAMREIGKGHSALSTFCGFMNLPPPMNKTSFNDLQEKLHDLYLKAADISMESAANELKKNDDDPITNITVSCDGTWQKRGFSSMNGVVTIIASETGKCLDYQVMSKVCNACNTWDAKKATDPDDYNNFHASHNCPINHEGSAGSMEAAGTVMCFSRSVDNRQLRYLKYIGDGDSKSYNEVVATNPYPGHTVEKLECVGHIQKRVGTRLRKLKTADKTLSGKGKLTDKIINKLQNYFGLAIRQNAGSSVYEMKKAIGAILFHCTEEGDPEIRHRMCPKNLDSWCKYQKSKIDPSIKFKESLGIPVAIKNKIKPIFQDLSDDTLLSKCLHGKTQNNNESINNVIWRRCPKEVFVGRSTIEIGVCSAVISFNDGAAGILTLFDLLGIIYGKFTEQYCFQKDTDRIMLMNRKEAVANKKRRKHLRSVKKGFNDKVSEKEGTTYGAGLF